MEAEGGAAAEEEQAEEEPQQIHLKLTHLAALTGLLQAIKIGAKQVSNVSCSCCNRRLKDIITLLVPCAGMQRYHSTGWALVEVGGRLQDSAIICAAAQ